MQRGKKDNEFLRIKDHNEYILSTSYHKKKLILHCYLIDRAPHITGTTISSISSYVITISRLQKVEEKFIQQNPHTKDMTNVQIEKKRSGIHTGGGLA